MSYKAGFRIPHEEKLCFNALVFATKEECGIYARDLLMRWYVPTGFEVVETEEKPNYKIEDHKLVRLEEVK